MGDHIIYCPNQDTFDNGTGTTGDCASMSRQAPRLSQVNQDTALLIMGSFYPGPDDFLALRHESVPEKLHQTEVRQVRKILLKTAAKRERD